MFSTILFRSRAWESWCLLFPLPSRCSILKQDPLSIFMSALVACTSSWKKINCNYQLLLFVLCGSLLQHHKPAIQKGSSFDFSNVLISATMQYIAQEAGYFWLASKPQGRPGLGSTGYWVQRNSEKRGLVCFGPYRGL